MVAKLNPGLGNRYSKEKMRQEIRDSGQVIKGKVTEGKNTYSTSSKFFGALQDEVTQNKGSYAKKKVAAAADGGEKSKASAAAALKL